MPAPTWDDIRSPSFEEEAVRILCSNPPRRRQVAGVVPVHGIPGSAGRYAAFRVLLDDGSRRVARLGLQPKTVLPPEPGFLGACLFAPAGQQFEADTAALLSSAGVPALVPDAVAEAEGMQIMWLPLLRRSNSAADPLAWQRALSAMPADRPEGFPVFTDRARKLEVLHTLGTGTAAALGDRYDLWMETLFEEATRWSVVHGNPAVRHGLQANGGNGANGGITLVDFADACWAPAAWDASGLVTSGIATQSEATALFGLTRGEMDAALALRAAGTAIMSAAVHPSAGLRAA